MDRSKEKTTIRVPKRGPGGPDGGNALPKGYVLQGRYIIESQLGSGGFGITYLAKHRYLQDNWVAIKEYLPEGAAVRDSSSRVHAISKQHSKIYSWGMHRFLDEARLLNQFKHPNIVAVDDFFEANNTAYLVMDYVRGRSIQDELDAGRTFDEGNLKQIIYPLLDALSLIHRDGLYHRDISPDNILLREDDDSPVLIDFGSARYEMRMRGAEQENDDQAHSPTTIFKQGYSPIEQYEGTTQGPYTDIYAFGATLYRAAFNSRPIDALKRSGEFRLTKKDPLVPASEKGKDRFSNEFLHVIDTAIQIDPTDRPQTVDEWLEIIDRGDKDHGAVAGRTPPHSQRRWVWLFVTVALIGAIAAGGYYWYQDREGGASLPTDVPGLLARATQELEKAPFRQQTQDEARRIYLLILTQDQDNIRALSGYNAANLLNQFNDTLAAEDQRNAVVLLNEAEDALKRAGIDQGILEPGWQRIALLNKLGAVRRWIPEAPLTSENWSSMEQLFAEIGSLPDGAAAAETGYRGLQALKETQDLISKNQFGRARTALATAQQAFAALGIGRLVIAESAIDEAESLFKAERLARIESLLNSAEELILKIPLSGEVLQRALGTYDEVIKLDNAHSKALAGHALAEKLAGTYSAMEARDFDSARKLLASARKISTNANIAPDAVNHAQADLTAIMQASAVAEAQAEIRGLFLESIKQLSDTPLNERSTALAKDQYQQALTKSADNDEFAAEQRVAGSGIALTNKLNRIIELVKSHKFEQAIEHLHSEQFRSLSDEVGLGPPLAVKVQKIIVDAEIEWNAQRVRDIANGQDLLQEKSLTALQLHVERISALEPEGSRSSTLSGLLTTLRSAVNARDNHEFEAAIHLLKQAEPPLRTAGASDNALASAVERIQREAITWEQKQKEQKSAAMLDQAFRVLAENPFAEDSWTTASQLVEAIDGDEARVTSGRTILLEIKEAHSAIQDASFAEALEAIGNAEKLMQRFGTYNLDTARTEVTAARRGWDEEQKRRISAALISARTILREGEFNSTTLEQARRIFTDTVGMPEQQAAAGTKLISVLEDFMRAIASNGFTEAEALLTEAGEYARAAQIDPQALNKAGIFLSASRDQWQTEQTKQEIASLIENASSLINNAPLDEDALNKAEIDYHKAIELNQSMPDTSFQMELITSGLETVFLLKAYKAELAEKQFAPLKNTLEELRGRLTAARLDLSISDSLRSMAVEGEIAWRIEKAREFIFSEAWFPERDLAPAEDQYRSVQRIRDTEPVVVAALQGIDSLKQAFRARDQRDYDSALLFLQQAVAYFSDAKIPSDSFNNFGQQLQNEKRRWALLTEERELITWTDEAVKELNSSPFSEQSWERATVLAGNILEMRTDDPRGTAVNQAVFFIRQAKQAIDALQFQAAKARVAQARATLMALGLEEPLKGALRGIETAAHEFTAMQLTAATAYLSRDPLPDPDLYVAKNALETILQADNDSLPAKVGIKVIDSIAGARDAAAATRYLEADNLLNEAASALSTTLVADSPVPELNALLARTRREIGNRRPSPGEIYPMVAAALRVVVDTPLNAEKLKSAESLLHNALGLQADEQTALASLKTIEHLRATAAALSEGRVDEARNALQQAQEKLTATGLAPSTLQAAWRTVEQAEGRHSE